MNVIRCAFHRTNTALLCKNLFGDLSKKHNKLCVTNNCNNRLHSTSVQISQDEKQSTSDDLKEKKDFSKGPGLADFIASSVESSSDIIEVDNIPYLPKINGDNQKVYLDVYGCQMNANDAEVVMSILQSNGYSSTRNLNEADVILLVTCAIRDNAEQKVWNRLQHLKHLRKVNRKKLFKPPLKIGLLGCMAERLKHKIIEQEKMVDLVAGPDSYKDLPRLLAITDSNEAAINVTLSFDETYADITPVRLHPENNSAFVSIMRGCDNMCTYCIVPFTRGRERSRPITSILEEVRHLADQGVKEIVLLGQNVNSYRDTSKSDFYIGDDKAETKMAKGFKTVYKSKKGGLRFSHLLDKVSDAVPEIRIRFTSPHPKDFPDEVLHLIAERPNICQQLHLPAQSGNSAVLERMRRGYSREAYLELIEHVRDILPEVSLTSDFICGFCDETEEEFQDTLSLIETVKYSKAFMFAYSMREKTTAHRRFKDNVPEEVKKERLKRMLKVYYEAAAEFSSRHLGKEQVVLIEGKSKKFENMLQGRSDGGTRVVIPNIPIEGTTEMQPGDYVVALINKTAAEKMYGDPLYKTTLQDYYSDSRQKVHGMS